MSNVDDVIAYFEGTRWDYRHLWRSEELGALHFGYYDTSTRDHRAALTAMTRFLAGTVGLTASDQVLDAGCGLGGCAIRLAQQYGCAVTGVNITPYQVAAARAAAKRADLADSVEFVEADFTNTKLPSSTFSVVWALESVVHTPDKAGFLREAYRLLAPGGRLVVAEYLLRDEPDLTSAEKADLGTWCQGWAMPELLRASDYRRLLRNQGFEDVRVIDISRHVVPSLRRLGGLVRLLAPTAPLFRRLRILAPVPAANLAASAAQLRTFDSRAWNYQVVTAVRPADNGAIPTSTPLVDVESTFLPAESAGLAPGFGPPLDAG